METDLVFFLPEDITFDSTRPFTSGAYGDLFKGNHRTKGALALKRLHRQSENDSDSKVAKRVTRSPISGQQAYISEARVWRKLCHPNVLSCLGILHNEAQDIFLVSPWMDNGSLMDFIASHPDVDRTSLVSAFFVV